MHRAVEEFVEAALQGPTDCRISISQIANVYDSLIAGLHKQGIPTPKIVDLINDKFLGVCPECATWSGGQGLSQLFWTMQKIGGTKILTGRTGGAERFLEGQCRNRSCNCTDMLLFWRPDEDDNTADRLAKMGIRIKHASVYKSVERPTREKMEQEFSDLFGQYVLEIKVSGECTNIDDITETAFDRAAEALVTKYGLIQSEIDEIAKGSSSNM